MDVEEILDLINSKLPFNELKHAICVALNITPNIHSDICKKAALLHDVVEDNYMSLNELKSIGIENTVTEIVDIVTRRSNETYSEYIDRIKQSNNIDAVYVKLSDLNVNICRCEKNSKGNLLKRYLKAKEQLKLVLLK